MVYGFFLSLAIIATDGEGRGKKTTLFSPIIMSKLYFVTGVVVNHSANPLLILLNDFEFEYEIVVCHNAKYDNKTQLFGGSRDFCDLFRDRLSPLRFVDKVEIIEEKGDFFPIVFREEENDDSKWSREIGNKELYAAIPNTPGSIMNFVDTKRDMFTRDEEITEKRYFDD